MLAAYESMLIPPYTIHRQIYLIRKFSGLNQIEMAKRLEITQGWLSKLESGMGDVTVSQLLALRKHFQLSADDVVDGTIDFLSLAKRFDNSVTLPSKYSDGARNRIRMIYGLVGSYERKFGSRTAVRMLRKLGIKPHFLADPQLLINWRLVLDVISACNEKSLFSDREAAREVARINLSAGTLGAKYQEMSNCKSPQEALSHYGKIIPLFSDDGQFEVKHAEANCAQLEVRHAAEFIAGIRKHPELLAALQEYNAQVISEVLQFGRANLAGITPEPDSDDEINRIKVCWA